MKLQITDLKTERHWRAATGCDEARFQKLLVVFTASYLALDGKSVADRQAESPGTACLRSETELLLFTLVSLKAGLPYDLLGLFCGLDSANVKRNQQLGLRVLEHALATVGALPAREFAEPADLAAYLGDEKTLIFDGTEQRKQRPAAAEAQRDAYTGKKNVTPSKPCS